MADFAVSSNIEKSIGAQSVKQAIEINETNLADLITDYNTLKADTVLQSDPEIDADLDLNENNIIYDTAGTYVTAVEIGYLDGVTSNIQDQIDDVASDIEDLGGADIEVSQLADGTDGELITWDADGAPATVGAGTAGQFLKSQGAGSVPVFDDVIQKVVQYAYDEDGTVASGAGTISFDNTKPQITEGNQFMSKAFTPTSATNLLRIDVTIALSTSNNSGTSMIVVGLFKTGTADALAATAERVNVADTVNTISFTHWMVAGAGATTFIVNAGMSGSGTLTFNGVGGLIKLNGSFASSLSITEYEV